MRTETARRIHWPDCACRRCRRIRASIERNNKRSEVNVKSLTRRGLNRDAWRQMNRCRNLLDLIGVISLAVAAAVLVALLLAHVFNGAIAA